MPVKGIRLVTLWRCPSHDPSAYGDTLWLADVVLRGNRARKGGGLFNGGMTTLSDVDMRGNAARKGPAEFSTRTATLTRRGRSSL